MTFAVMLAGKSLLAAGPLAYVWPLFGMRPQVPSEVEATSESATTTRHRALKMSLVSAPVRASELGGGSCDLLLFNLKNRRKAGHAAGRWIMVGTDATLARACLRALRGTTRTR